VSVGTCCCKCCVSDSDGDGDSDSDSDSDGASQVNSCDRCRHAASDDVCATTTTTPTTTTTTTAQSTTTTRRAAIVVQQPDSPAVATTSQPLATTTGRPRSVSRTDFAFEHLLTAQLATLTDAERADLGFSVNEMVLDCQFAGSTCKPRSDSRFIEPVLDHSVSGSGHVT